MEQMLISNNEWNKISPSELKNTIDVLKQYHFSTNDITDVLKSAPDLCSIDKDELVAILEAWLTCQFSLEMLIDLLSTQPILLKVEKEEIPERIPTLLFIFNNNRNKLHTFLKSSPEVMFQNFDEIIEKYNYIRHEMGAKPKELLNSKVLGCDMLFIKTRHMFLDRSGQFFYRTKNTSELDNLGNPTLNAIFDSSDKIFAEKVANMSVLEYDTFCSYYKQELEEVGTDISDEEG